MTDSDLQKKRLTAVAIDVGIYIVIMVAFSIMSWIAGFALIKMTDSNGMIATFVPRILNFLGNALGLAYVLGRDLTGGDRSFGKKLQNIRVVTVSGAPIAFMDSVKRNAIFAIGSALGMLSATLGLIPCIGDVVNCLLLPLVILGGLIGLVVLVLEIMKITQEPEGIRMGDQFAGTRVVN
jgi:RDD family